ncbi:MAG: hypothetical protein ABR613_07785 [Actinomycetota bacterium]
MVSLTAASLVAVPVSPSPAAGGAAPKSATVVAEGGPAPFTWEWNPPAVTIGRRGRVTWENPTDTTHHVTFWDGPGAPHGHLDPGGTAAIRFRKPGVYKYWCDIFGHADIVTLGYDRVCVGMCGEVTVE